MMNKIKSPSFGWARDGFAFFWQSRSLLQPTSFKLRNNPLCETHEIFPLQESEEAKRLREERLAQYESKKAKKPALVAKSSILLDVKPWDDETDMAKLEECVRSIQADGLVWGSSKLVPVGYGIKKLQIQCVVEDDKVGTDMLEEQIIAFDEYIQSMDVAAFNKI